MSQKNENYAYEYERRRFGEQSGFHYMWESVRNIEILWLRFVQNMRRYGKIHENLQMYVDELVWRAEHRSLAERREALCACFSFKLAQETQESVGIGGGYG